MLFVRENREFKIYRKQKWMLIREKVQIRQLETGSQEKE